MTIAVIHPLKDVTTLTVHAAARSSHVYEGSHHKEWMFQVCISLSSRSYMR